MTNIVNYECEVCGKKYQTFLRHAGAECSCGAYLTLKEKSKA